MECHKVGATAAELSRIDSPEWQKHTPETIALSPTPVAMLELKSPYLAHTSHDHGAVKALQVIALHNGEVIALKLSWACPVKRDQLTDLDQFADAAAILFPLTGQPTSAMTMGAQGAPVSAWLYSTHRKEPFDVMAEGYGTTQRRPGKATGLTAKAAYQDGRWQVVFQRPLSVKTDGAVQLQPGKTSSIAFAVWEGSNQERSGRKAISGDFVNLNL